MLAEEGRRAFDAHGEVAEVPQRAGLLEATPGRVVVDGDESGGTVGGVVVEGVPLVLPHRFPHHAPVAEVDDGDPPTVASLDATIRSDPVWSASTVATGVSVPSARRTVSPVVRTPAPSSEAATTCPSPVSSRRRRASSVATTEAMAHRWSMKPNRCHIGGLPSPAPRTSHPQSAWNSWS